MDAAVAKNEENIELLMSPFSARQYQMLLSLLRIIKAMATSSLVVVLPLLRPDSSTMRLTLGSNNGLNGFGIISLTSIFLAGIGYLQRYIHALIISINPDIVLLV